jgi:hypothetical protein
VGGVTYDEADRTFATALGRNLPGGRSAALELAQQISPLRIDPLADGGGSTDVG